MNKMCKIMLAALIAACPAMHSMSRIAGMGSWAWNGFKNNAQSVVHTAGRIPARALHWIVAHKGAALCAVTLIAAAAVIAKSNNPIHTAFSRRKAQVTQWARDKYWLLTDPDAARDARRGKLVCDEMQRLKKIYSQEISHDCRAALNKISEDFGQKHPGIIASFWLTTKLQNQRSNQFCGIECKEEHISCHGQPAVDGSSQNGASRSGDLAKLMPSDLQKSKKDELLTAAKMALYEVMQKAVNRHEGLSSTNQTFGVGLSLQ